MKQIFNYLFIFLAGVSATSCNEKSSDQTVTPNSEKVLALPAGDVLFNGSEFVFENLNVFEEYLKKIAAEPKVKADIETKYAHILLAGQLNNKAYKKAYLFSSLSSNDYALVNNNGRMTIGDVAIRFDSLYQYLAPAKEAHLLNFTDEKDMDSKVFKTKYGLIPLDESNVRVSNFNGANGATNQQSPWFYYQAPDPYAGQPTKYVNEVVAQYYMPVLGQVKRSLLLIHKLEYMSGGSGNIYPANQPRNIVDNFNVNGNLFWNNMNQPTFNKTISQTHSAVTNNVVVTLHDYITPPNGGNGIWNFEITGTINSQVISPNGFNYSWNKSGLIW